MFYWKKDTDVSPLFTVGTEHQLPTDHLSRSAALYGKRRAHSGVHVGRVRAAGGAEFRWSRPARFGRQSAGHYRP